jgi:hypothetical protein
MLKPERKSPSMPTVEMLSPFVIYAVHDEISFDHICPSTPSPLSVSARLVSSSKSLLHHHSDRHQGEGVLRWRKVFSKLEAKALYLGN